MGSHIQVTLTSSAKFTLKTSQTNLLEENLEIDWVWKVYCNNSRHVWHFAMHFLNSPCDIGIDRQQRYIALAFLKISRWHGDYQEPQLLQVLWIRLLLAQYPQTTSPPIWFLGGQDVLWLSPDSLPSLLPCFPSPTAKNSPDRLNFQPNPKDEALNFR